MGMVQFMTDLGIYDNISYYQEHCDGPLFRVYYTNEEWVVSTSSLIYADGHWLNTKTNFPQHTPLLTWHARSHPAYLVARLISVRYDLLIGC